MTSAELKNLLRAQFGMKKPWFGDDPIMCRDREYPQIEASIYIDADFRTWGKIINAGYEYSETFPDCDDASDMKLGVFKLEWLRLIKEGKVTPNTQPSYAVGDGYNPKGEMHDFNLFVADQIYVSDYGQIVDPTGYRPIKIRF